MMYNTSYNSNIVLQVQNSIYPWLVPKFGFRKNSINKSMLEINFILFLREPSFGPCHGYNAGTNMNWNWSSSSSTTFENRS